MDSIMGIVRAGEYWGGLPEFPDYLIGSHGAVISLRQRRPRVLSPIKMGLYRGYQMKDYHDVLQKRYVHRLVAELVYGPCPEGLECRHLDGDRANNDYKNLRWGTHAENERDKGWRVTHSKLDFKSAAEMREIRAQSGKTYKERARMFGVTSMTAYRAVTGQSWNPENNNAE
jgi:hypothetical protein